LRALTRATRAIARGEAPPRPVRVRSKDEIGELAVSFNTMSSDLQRAQDELLVAARFASIGEVAAGVAHEVRTPLGILRSSAQLLGRMVPKERPEAEELLGTIIGEVDRLDRVIAELLQLARPHEPLIEPTLLAPVLSRALDLVEPQAREKQLALHRELDAEQRPAQCDPDQIYQVALNLIVNAVQILRRGGSITVRTASAGNGRVAFEVSDDGPGIPADLREQIFTPFFTTRDGGTGLGLALVQRVVQAHKGRVTVASQVGRGTTFRVELPASEEPG
jgi:two-component system, NtrC family, sensor histidine kinase HydH